ncbi:MAG: twin-arginine translocation signal domain-containing protein [Verrucomicrobia bacterium]|nr:twin-arginine translocation signal domain-containing protein [Verrucomicrobiota bacterium]
MNDKITRRRFISTTGVAAAGAAIAPSILAKNTSANDKVVFGLIGCGGMGRTNMRNLMQFDEVEDCPAYFRPYRSPWKLDYV